MKKPKSLPKLKAEAQILFNSWVRKRDEGLPCISCGEHKPDMQAGHYFAVGGYDGLRFNEDNAHLECRYDNCFNESHLIHYGTNLIERIGKERYNKLMSDALAYKMNGYKWSRSEVTEIIAKYKKKLSEL